MWSALSRDLWAYLRTRFPVYLVVGLPLLLALAALRERARSPVELVVTLAMALLLVLELRLWDDLRDVDFDRQVHPERVLCQTASLRPFWQVFYLLVAINLGLAALVRGWWGAGLLLGLHALLAVWYGWRGTSYLRPVLNYHVVLLKYPVIVWLLGAESAASSSLWIPALSVYLALCIWEPLHDAVLRRLRGAQICLAVECLLLAAVGCWAVSFAHWPALPP